MRTQREKEAAGKKHSVPKSPALQVDSLPSEPPDKAYALYYSKVKKKKVIGNY